MFQEFGNNKMPDISSLMENSDIKNLFSMFDNTSSIENNKPKATKQNNNNFLDNIKNIWTNEYYDAQEELDDFLIKDEAEAEVEPEVEPVAEAEVKLEDEVEAEDENEAEVELEAEAEDESEYQDINLTKYLKNTYDNIFFEVCFNSCINKDEYINKINKIINKDEYNKILEIYKEKLVDEPETMSGEETIKSPDGITNMEIKYDKLIKKHEDEEYLSVKINMKNKEFEYGMPYSKIEEIKNLLIKLC